MGSIKIIKLLHCSLIILSSTLRSINLGNIKRIEFNFRERDSNPGLGEKRERSLCPATSHFLNLNLPSWSTLGVFVRKAQQRRRRQPQNLPEDAERLLHVDPTRRPPGLD